MGGGGVLFLFITDYKKWKMATFDENMKQRIFYKMHFSSRQVTLKTPACKNFEWRHAIE